MLVTGMVAPSGGNESERGPGKGAWHVTSHRETLAMIVMIGVPLHQVSVPGFPHLILITTLRGGSGIIFV